jgi:hypothetical protein
MSARTQIEETRPETLLLLPLVVILFAVLVYFFVELLPKVRVLPG